MLTAPFLLALSALAAGALGQSAPTPPTMQVSTHCVHTAANNRPLLPRDSHVPSFLGPNLESTRLRRRARSIHRSLCDLGVDPATNPCPRAPIPSLSPGLHAGVRQQPAVGEGRESPGAGRAAHLVLWAPRQLRGPGPGGLVICQRELSPLPPAPGVLLRLPHPPRTQRNARRVRHVQQP